MKTSLSNLWKKEDWLAVWIGFIIISAGAVAVLTGAFDFSAAKFSTWHLWEDVAEKKALLAQFTTAAILDENFQVLSGVNTPNDYMGPGTGYRVEGKRWEEIKKIPHLIDPKDI